MSYAEWGVAILLAYLSGSIPFGLLIGLSKGVDLRDHGSKNIGATNCGRVLGRRYGAACFALDLLKGLVPVAVVGWWSGLIGPEAAADPREQWAWLLTGAGAILGHIFPVWLRFHGGKGVATGLGVVLGVWPDLTLPAVAAIGTWLVVVGVSRYVGLSSVIAAVALPLYAAGMTALQGRPVRQVAPYLAVTGAMAALIVWRHRANLQRTWRGTESRIGTGSRRTT